MSENDPTESDVSDDGEDAPAAPGADDLEKVRPTADVDIAGDEDGEEAGFTFPGPGA